MKRIISLTVCAALLLTLCACGNKFVSDTAPAAVVCVLTAFEGSSQEPVESDGGIDYRSEEDWEVSLNEEETVFINRYGSNEAAEEFSKYYSADGSQILYPDGSAVAIDYVEPVHLWLYGDCIVRFAGTAETALSLKNVFGEQFAGASFEEISNTSEDGDAEASDGSELGEDSEHAEVTRLVSYLESIGEEVSVKEEDVSKYDNFYVNPFVEAYIVSPSGKDDIYIRIYENAETAADEASQYSPDDPSVYGNSIVDYALPVHFWLSGEAIIELGTSSEAEAQRLSDFYGEQFSGFPISDDTDSREQPDPAEPDESSDDDPDSKEPAGTFGSEDEIVLDVQAYDINMFGCRQTDEEPDEKSWVINDADRCAEVSELLKGVYNSPQLDFLDGFGEEFFKDNSLIVLNIYEPCVSADHELESAVLKGNTAELEILNTDTGDDAEDYCVMIIQVKKKLGDIEVSLKKRTVRKSLNGEPNYADDYTYKCVRADGSVYPLDTVITSRQELEDYYASINDGTANYASFAEAMEYYTEDWFEENTLVIIAREVGSGSIEFSVKGVSVSENGVEIILKTKVPETGTADMAGWQIMVGLNGVKLNKNASVKVVEDGKSSGLKLTVRGLGK